MEASAVSARLIGAIFVDKGLISDADLELALEEQEKTGVRLGEILVSSFGVSRIALSSALAEQWTAIERANAHVRPASERTPAETDAGDMAAIEQEWRPPDDESADAEERRPIGEIFVEKGVITEDQLARALDEQQRTGARLGEVLVAQETLTRLELASALAEQWSDLQKLRPPEPSPIRTAAGAHQLPTSAAAASSEAHPELARMTEELRHAVAALEQRVAGVAISEPLVERLGAVENGLAGMTVGVDELRAALGEIRERLDEITTAERLDKTVIDRIHRSIEQLAQRIAMAEELSRINERDPERLPDGELARRVDELEERLGAEVAVHAAVEELRARLDEHEEQLTGASGVSHQELQETAARLSNAIESVASLQDLRPVVDGLVSRADELGGAGTATELLELRAALAAVEERIVGTAELAERLQRIEESQHDAREITTQQTVLAQRVDELLERTANATGDAALAGLRERVDAFDARVAAAEVVARAELDETASRLSVAIEGVASVERLEPVVAELAGRVAGAADAAELAELRSSIGALEGRIAAAEALARAELDETTARLSAAIEDASVGRLEPVIAELAGRVAGAAEVAELAELRASVGVLEARIAAIAATARAELDEMTARHADALDVVGSLEGLAPRVDDLAVELRAGLERIEQADDPRVAAALAAAEDARREIADLAGRLADTTAARLHQTIDEIATQVSDLRGRLGGLATTVSEAARREDVGASVAAVESAVEELRGELAAAVERAAGSASQESVSAVARSVEQIAERVAELRAEETNARIDELTSRMVALEPTLDVEGALADQRQELQAVATELRDRIEQQGNKLDGIDVEQLGYQLAGLSERVNRHAAAFDSEIVGHMRAELTGIVKRVDSLDLEVERVTTEAGRRLRDELEAAAAALRERLDEHERRLEDVGTDELGQRIDRLAESLASAASRDELGEQIAGLDGRIDGLIASDVVDRLGDELRSQSAELERRLREHEQSVESTHNTLEGLARAESLNEVVTALERHDHRLDEIDARGNRAGAELDALADQLRGRLEEQDRRVARAEADVAARATVDELRDTSAETARRLEDQERALAQAISRDSEIRARLDRADQLVGRIERTELRVEELEDHGDGGLEERLGVLAADLQERLEKHERRLEKHARKLDDARETAERSVTELTTGFEQRFDAVERKVASTVKESRTRLEENSDRIDLLDAALGDQAQRTADTATELRNAVAQVEQRVTREGKALEQRARELVETTTAETAARIDALASSEVVDALRVRMEIMERHLADRLARDTERDAAGKMLADRIDSVDEVVDERITAAAAAADAKLEAVVRAVDDELQGRHTDLERSLVDLRSQIVDQAQLAEQQASASEHALRDGLAALATQLAEGESAYLRAGELLRTSIDRLGGALGETDRRIAARADNLPIATASEAASYVAFAPTASGYRLVEVDGAAPAIGETVQLPGENAPLVAVRLGTSPLPLDLRPCVYLESQSSPRTLARS